MEALGPDTLSARPQERGWVRTALVLYAGMAALAWLGRTAWQGQPLFFADAAAAARGIAWGESLGLGLGAAGVALMLSELFTRRTSAGAVLARTLGEALGPLSWRQSALLALASGVGEEALFRGALQPNLGLVGASLLFGAVHFAPRRGLWAWSAFAVVGGLGLGALQAWTGNLLAPILAHATLNGVNLWRLARDHGRGLALGKRSAQ